jgi:hypothetical protein
VVSLPNLERTHFSHGMTAKVKNIVPKVRGALAEGASASPKAMTSIAEDADIRLRRRRHKLPDHHQRVADYAFHKCQSPPATDEAKEWGEVSVADYSLV